MNQYLNKNMVSYSVTLVISTLLLAGCGGGGGDDNDNAPLPDGNTSGEIITGSDLDPNAMPSDNFDLSAWYIGVPVDEDGDGKSDNIDENELNRGYEKYPYFYTSRLDGGLVFLSNVEGPKTSTNTSYTRSELRSMLRRGDTSIKTQGVNKNNWVFGTAPTEDLYDAGGVDGTLTATLAVNYVTTTGDSSQVGRVIIGQIHANDDEPARLYYRKLPGNSKGSIYLAHEPRDGYGSEIKYNLIGSSSSSASNPSDGIALNEKFSYKIQTNGDLLMVTIMRDNKPDIMQTVDMVNSGYNLGGQYMYFKAGVYNQNNTGDATDYVQATFYYLNHQYGAPLN